MEGSPREADAPAEGTSSGLATEGRSERLRRHRTRGRLYAMAFGLVAVLVALVALVLANTRSVEISWVVGSTHASLVWIILVAAILGWLSGLATAALLRRRTRRAAQPDSRPT